MNVLFNKQNFIYFLSLILVSVIVINIFHAYGQNSKHQQIPGLFGNGSNLLNDAFRKVKDSVVKSPPNINPLLLLLIHYLIPIMLIQYLQNMVLDLYMINLVTL